MKRNLAAAIVMTLVIGACGGAETSSETTSPSSSTTTATTVESSSTTAATTTSTTAAEAGGAPSSSSLQAFQQSLADTSAVQSFRMEGGISLTGIEGAPGVSDFSLPMSGEFDTANGAFTMLMDLSGIAAVGGDEIDAQTASLFGEMEVRTIGNTAYMRSGFFSLLGVTTEWVSMPAEDADATTTGLGTASPTNPMDLLAPFANADAEITEIGPETVRGVPTTHYQVVVDVQRLAEQVAPGELDSLQAQVPLPLTVLPMDFWIGADGLVYRYAITISGEDVSAQDGGFGQMVLQFEMFDFGAPITITAPPASDVTDSTAIAGFSNLTG